MKKIFSLIALLALIVSCGGSNSNSVSGGGAYKIDGTIAFEGIVDGDSLSMGYSNDGMSYTPESYAVIKDGKFKFSGKVKSTQLCYLVNHKTEEPLAQLFLEGGDITVSITNENLVVSGTASNDGFNNLQATLQDYVMKLQEKQFALYLDTTLTEAQREDILGELQTLSEQASSVAKEFVTTNISTLPGLFMLVQCANLFEEQEFDALANQVPENFKECEDNCLYDVLLNIQEQRKNPQDFSNDFEMLEQMVDSIASETPETK